MCAVEVFDVFDSPFDLRDGLQFFWDSAAHLTYTPFLSRRGDAIQWAFKLNSALAAAETWHFRDCVLKVSWKCLLLQYEECMSVLYPVICVKVEVFWSVKLCELVGCY